MPSRPRNRRGAARSSHAAARQPPQSRRSEQGTGDLPPYEPPRCPLTEDAEEVALRSLSTNRASDRYRKGLAITAQLLSNSVYAINERLTYRKKFAAQAAERAAKKKNTSDAVDAESGDAMVERAEAVVREAEEKVTALTRQVEEAVREVLDMQAALQDERAIMGELPDLVAAKQQLVQEQALQDQALQDQEGGDKNGGPSLEVPGLSIDDIMQRLVDGDKNKGPPHEVLGIPINDILQRLESGDGNKSPLHEVPGVPILDILQEERDAKAAEYEKLSPYEKYAVNNSYIEFKKSWHQGLFPDEEVPVPDATKWFDKDGRPRQMTHEGGEDGENGGDGSDDDIQIAREKRSFKCPLSLSTMKEPYTCKQCKHSFERRFIVEYIKGPNKRGHTAKCPISGCHVTSMSIKDLYLDEALLRRIKRAEEMEREELDRSEEEEEEEDFVDDYEGHNIMEVDPEVKSEPGN